jgi:broad specificity phosphatase PhoE
MRVALIRHLPTESNRAGLLQGRLDPPILPPDDETRVRIEQNRASLQREFPDFDHVLVSSLRRTAMTADAYGYLGGSRAEPLLDELDFGPYEARPRSEMLAEIGDTWFEAPDTLTLGEPIAALGDRVRSLLAKYGKARNLLLFGHGAWLRALLSLVREGSLRGMNKLTIEHNALTVLEVPAHARQGIREQQ